MTIALMADNRKKELMVQFCIAYCGALSKHELCATGRTGKAVAEATGLKIECMLPGAAGGEEQLSARAAYNELDLVLVFRDPTYVRGPNIENLIRHCDLNSIPIATNIATAEVLIQGLTRGDLAWREFVRTPRQTR